MATGPTTITVAGGDLFRLAAQYLGDSTQWNRIAQANGMTDYLIQQTTTLIIPVQNVNASNGGILIPS